MRIVGGSKRGKKLLLPQDKRIRPTADRTREALFNILAHDSDMRSDHGPLPQGARVLDVYAGTGALGLEALSRGAAHVTFMDNHPDSLNIIRANIREMGFLRSSDVLNRTALTPGKPGGPYDLVLMDPPYGEGLALPTLQALQENGWLGQRTVIVMELAKKSAFEAPARFDILKDRHYGAARLIFLRQVPDQYDDTSQTAPE
ncbi:MAG: 16S rRNA (guanine(966)-N(2))-methyltransferase RsmD [Sneathiella sp.]|jgi:16S rRNA (guanine966-N2)-methyltransferase|uniref:16S rRNA (guanine(966)-N(2))-methyltransferase RsmD n=1 Tax=Sneathiella sp. TaxID=1964365 RepID=UPI000C6AEDAB|nr:16S rRNA (guanine(966)-N(2))-methyltransferase RsmD [Sneathiella sp.]MAL78655.1 16S rRNA (guanine(966)-N(2))-methyltransferase RsmD [Sneathiella sp.]